MTFKLPLWHSRAVLLVAALGIAVAFAPTVSGGA